MSSPSRFYVYTETTLATIIFRSIHNYVIQDVDIFLNKAVVIYHFLISISQYIYNICADKYDLLYESLNEPTNCQTTVSTPMKFSNTLQFVSQGFPYKEPLFYRETKTVCSYSNPLDYINIYSCKFKKKRC